MLGGTIHDVAQVVGAEYAVPATVGNTAVIVKLFGVFLLLPVVLAVGSYFTNIGMRHGEARVPVPVFLVLCALTALSLLARALLPLYAGQRRTRGGFELGVFCSPPVRSALAPRPRPSSGLG
jgi:uncharacterized membrane protein YadS